MKKIITLFFLILLSSVSLYSEPKSVSEVIDGIDIYRNKTLTLKLKLKYVDRIFEKIFFYDSDNIDIEFDIADKELKKSLHGDMLNLHEGMDYNVSFEVTGKGNLGGLIAVLKEFRPVIIDKIPLEDFK